MNRKKVIFLLVSLVFMVSLVAGVVSAQSEGIGKALGKIGELFSSVTGVVSLDKILGGDRIALAYSYFIIWLIFFAGTDYGTGFVFKDRPRIQMAVAIGFSLFILLIPPTTMVGIAKLYSMAYTLVIWLVPVGVALIVSWKVESKAAKAVLYFGLLLLLSQANGAVQAYFGPDFTQNEWYSLFYVLYIVAIIGFIWNLVTMWDVFRGAGDRLAGRVGDLADKGVDRLLSDKEEEKAEKEIITNQQLDNLKFRVDKIMENLGKEQDNIDQKKYNLMQLKQKLLSIAQKYLDEFDLLEKEFADLQEKVKRGNVENINLVRYRLNLLNQRIQEVKDAIDGLMRRLGTAIEEEEGEVQKQKENEEKMKKAADEAREVEAAEIQAEKETTAAEEGIVRGGKKKGQKDLVEEGIAVERAAKAAKQAVKRNRRITGRQKRKTEKAARKEGKEETSLQEQKKIINQMRGLVTDIATNKVKKGDIRKAIVDLNKLRKQLYGEQKGAFKSQEQIRMLHKKVRNWTCTSENLDRFKLSLDSKAQKVFAMQKASRAARRENK